MVSQLLVNDLNVCLGRVTAIPSIRYEVLPYT